MCKNRRRCGPLQGTGREVCQPGQGGGDYLAFAARPSVPLPHDRFWDFQVPKIDSLTRQPFVPRPPCVRADSPEHRCARRWLRSTPTVAGRRARMRALPGLRPGSIASRLPRTTRIALRTSMAGSGGGSRMPWVEYISARCSSSEDPLAPTRNENYRPRPSYFQGVRRLSPLRHAKHFPQSRLDQGNSRGIDSFFYLRQFGLGCRRQES